MAGITGSQNNPAEDMGGYYGQENPAGHSKSYDESTQTSKEVRHGAKQGVLRVQEVGPQGNSGGGKSITVTTASVDKEAAKKCADKQVGSNRQYINESVRKHQGEPE